jgi:CheY-like chemotaxis protein
LPIAESKRRDTMHTRKPRILIVEDDVQIRLLLSTILEEAGYTVRPAADAFAALEEMQTESPDVLLSDLYMPGMSGFELLTIVRHQFPTTRVVAMSSAFSGEDLPMRLSPMPFIQRHRMLPVCCESWRR